MTFEQAIQTSPFMLLEAAIIERLRRDPQIQLHSRLENTPLIYSTEGRTALATLYREYVDIARHAQLPIVLNTPTWRANQERLTEANLEVDVNANAVEFMQQVKEAGDNVFIGGLVGCKNDCYKPEEALSSAEAVDFHSWQINQLNQCDVLYAVTLPEFGEALGIAQAMAGSSLPYVISFVIGQTGRMLDGTPLESAIARIDAKTERSPLGYGVNCCHPSFLQAAKLQKPAAERLISIQANASSLSHAELEKTDSVKADPIDDWCTRIIDLSRGLNLKILGGCCGTTAAHLRSIVEAAPHLTTG